MNLKNAILADTSALLALLNKKDMNHEAVKPFATAKLLVSSTVLCEFDYMATKYLGEPATLAFLQGQARGEWQLLSFDATDLENTNLLRLRYSDVPLGFVDSSLLILAERYAIPRVLTLDKRHFWTVRSQSFGHFELLP
ncbi:MAG: hypothetical protein RLZZ156_1142 [Deinococcota bacterium]